VFGVGVLGPHRRDAGADGHAQRLSVVPLDVALLDVLAPRFGHTGRAGRVRCNDEGEFLAAEARGQIGLADPPQQEARHVLKDPVPGRVPERVVHALEVVEVGHHHRERCAEAPCALELQRERAIQHPSIRQPGEIVGRREMFEEPVLLLELVLQTGQFEVQFDAGDEVVGLERLGDHVARTLSQQPRAAIGIVDGGQHQERQPAPGRALRHQHELLALEARHLDVAQDQVDVARDHALETADPVLGFEDAIEDPRRAEQAPQGRPLGGGIVDDEQRRHAGFIGRPAVRLNPSDSGAGAGQPEFAPTPQRRSTTASIWAAPCSNALRDRLSSG